MTTFSHKKRLISIFTLMLSVLLLTFWACRKEKPELTLPEADPCELDKPVEASFWMGMSASKQYLLDPCGSGIFGDTILPTDYGIFDGGAFLYFTANADCYDELEWIVGYDPQHRFGKQIYVQFFSADVAGTTLPITLIAKKKPNLLCYPDDDGVDTVTRMITFLNTSSRLYGHFHGNNIGDDPNDAFTVWIKDDTSDPNNYIVPTIEGIWGLPRGSNYDCNNNLSYTYIKTLPLVHRKFSFCGKNSVNGTFWDCPSNNIFPHVNGIVEYSADYDTVTITYQFADDVTLPNEGNNTINKVFVGVRI